LPQPLTWQQQPMMVTTLAISFERLLVRCHRHD
jgi:hypothetical protein